MAFLRFRWVFCQLETLRNCLPQNVRRVLQELPASLDETYERMLRDILKANPDQAYRLLQCLTVATRPLGVDELAEILALNFDGAKDGIPALNKDWRWDDGQQGVLATCSSLIVVVDSYDYSHWRTTRVVQFAHFSVKEFLTADRLADIKADISRFHIRLEPAHTVIAQACLAILLQSDHDDRTERTSPLSCYAAQHWVDHVRFGRVSSPIEYGMQRLFDPAKPYFIAWLTSYDCDHEWTSFLRSHSDPFRSTDWYPEPKFTEDAAPLCLYYAAFCGFRDLTRYLIAKYPQHVNATVGLNMSPLAAALRNRHIQVAELLCQHGAVLPIGTNGRTLLHAASADGLVDVAQWLLNMDADANAHETGLRTPIDFAAANGRLERILLDHCVDINGSTNWAMHIPSCEASSHGHVEIVRPLVEHGANVNARDQSQSTPLHLAWDAEIVQLLVEHGADVNARDQFQLTPLHIASSVGKTRTVQLLIEHGADVNSRDQSQSTPLHLALSGAKAQAVQLLIEHGADVNARDQCQSTPLHLALSRGYAEVSELLIEHGADVNSRDQSQSTPLHVALSQGGAKTAQLLIKHGADVHARNQDQSTPLHVVSSVPSMVNNETTIRLLIEHGASVNAYDKNHQTPLHWVSSCYDPNANSLRLLLKNGADVDAEDDKGLTAFQIASSKGHDEIAQLLLDYRACIGSSIM
jgi:ankyrin repeat protein